MNQSDFDICSASREGPLSIQELGTEGQVVQASCEFGSFFLTQSFTRAYAIISIHLVAFLRGNFDYQTCLVHFARTLPQTREEKPMGGRFQQCKRDSGIERQQQKLHVCHLSFLEADTPEPLTAVEGHDQDTASTSMPALIAFAPSSPFLRLMQEVSRPTVHRRSCMGWPSPLI